jgi:protein HIRA/HIR1
LTDRIIESYEYKSKHQPRRVPKNPPIVQENSFGTSAASSSKVNTIQPKKKKKGDTRRLVSRPATNQAMPRESTGAGSLNSRDAFATPEQNSTSAGPLRLDMLRDAPSRSDFGNGVNQLEARGSKRKAITLGDSGRTMVSTRPRIAPEVRELRAPRLPASGGSGSSSGKVLGSPQIQSVLRAKTKDGSDEYFLQAENAGSGGYNKVTFIEDGADIWLDYLPSAILVMAISENFCAVACEDGNLYVYSHAGRQ